MTELDTLLRNNREWAERIKQEDPGYFWRLAQQQAPRYLWIGCSDSRVPANEILGLRPGEVFVHRNVGNLVVHSDLNCLTVLQYAVEVLKVEHVLVVGHYGCGGVQAVIEQRRTGLADNWLRHVGDVALKHAPMLADVDTESLRHARLCELNVIEQVFNVCQTTVVEDAWARGQNLAVHGWVYSLFDGRVRQLGMDVSSAEALAPAYQRAIAAVRPGDNRHE